MIITERQKNHLSDAIIDIQLALSSLIKEIDSESGANAAGSILENLAIINSALIQSKVEKIDWDKELFF
jgi:hypothetical protein